jgi:hypothetical protein
MNGAARRVKLAHMSRVGDPAELRSAHLQDWRDASKRVLLTYKTWCAAGRQDRHEEYLWFLNALGREERAAWEVERDSQSAVSADSRPLS